MRYYVLGTLLEKATRFQRKLLATMPRMLLSRRLELRLLVRLIRLGLIFLALVLLLMFPLRLGPLKRRLLVLVKVGSLMVLLKLSSESLLRVDRLMVVNLRRFGAVEMSGQRSSEM